MNSPSESPNILWITTDQQRGDTIQALGNPYIRTPNLDRLCAEGTAFDTAYCQSPLCTPSRASFLTGMYPSSVHACQNGGDYWAEGAPLIPQLLQEHGYVCGLSGKLHLERAEGRSKPHAQSYGYDRIDWSCVPEDRWPDQDDHDYKNWLQSLGLDLAELKESAIKRIPPEIHQTTWCTDKVIEFIDEAGNRPFLMSVNPFDPHRPFDPPLSYLANYDPEDLPPPAYRKSDHAAQARLAGVDFQTACRPPDEFNAQWYKAAYYAMIELIDHNVGRLLDHLEDKGLSEKTIVIFTSDHGEMLGDHGLLLKGCRFYDGLTRVPLIIRWPGMVQEGLISSALVELTDIAPTLLEACGLPVPERMQGQSLWPVLTGARSAHRKTVRSEYYHGLNPRGKHGHDWEGSYATMIRDERFKLSVYHGHGFGELFDMEKDPQEFDNLWDNPDFADVRFRLMLSSFDALAYAVDLGPEQTGYW